MICPLQRLCEAARRAISAEECQERKAQFSESTGLCKRDCQHFGSMVPAEMVGTIPRRLVVVPYRPERLLHRVPEKRAPVTPITAPKKLCKDCGVAEISARAERCVPCNGNHLKEMGKAGLWKPGRKPMPRINFKKRGDL